MEALKHFKGITHALYSETALVQVVIPFVSDLITLITEEWNL